MDKQDPAVKCAKALFLSTTSFGVILGLISLTVLLVLGLTTILHSLIKPYAPPSATTTSEPSTPLSSTDADELPPYSERDSSNAATKHRSTAESFVIGSFLVIPILAALVTLGLCIQNLLYCSIFTSTATDGPTFGSVISWILYSLLASYASSGIVTWFILLRNLWLYTEDVGAAAPIPQDIVPMVVVGTILLPFVIVGRGLVAGVKFLQARFCLSNLIEVVEEDVELDQTGLLDGDELHSSMSQELHKPN